MKKRFALFLTMVMVLSLALTACGGSGNGGDSQQAAPAETGSETGESAENTTEGGTEAGDLEADISIWVLEDKADAMEYAVELFKEIQPGVNVEVVAAAVDVHKQNLKVSASSKTLPTAWFNWGGNLGSFYTNNGLTYDLTGYASENGWNDIFESGVIDLCTFDGQLAGYPLSMNMLGVFYRKDIFEENNIEVPETFEEFEAVCETLKEAGVTPISTGGKFGWHSMRFFEQFVEYYAGAAEHDKLQFMEESWGPGTDSVNKAFAKYQEFAEKGYFPEGFVSEDPNDSRMLIYSGNAAMQLEGQWFDGQITGDDQNVDDYGYFSFPSSDTPGEGRMSAFAEMFQINADVTDAELEAAIAFLDVYTSQEVINEYPHRFNLPLPKAGAEMPDGMPHVAEMVEEMSQRGTFTITDQAFPTEVADVLFAAQDAVALGSMDPDDAGETIQDAIESFKAAN